LPKLGYTLYEERNIAMIKWIVLLCVFVGMVLVVIYGGEWLSFEALKANRAFLLTAVETRYTTSVGVFCAIYVFSVALSVPGASLLTLTAGFLFGPWVGTVLVVLSATVGATFVFMLARSTLGGMLRHRVEGVLGRTQRDMQDNAFYYLLMTRLIPVFPFFAMNLVPAFLNVGLCVFVLTTFIGIVPGSFIYVNMGTGLGRLLESNGGFDLSQLLSGPMIVALTGLGLLALLPVMLKKRGRG
jgi:uncharacterized membrane protein YdjX (TVP38/TMEM64 family)